VIKRTLSTHTSEKDKLQDLVTLIDGSVTNVANMTLFVDD